MNAFNKLLVFILVCNAVSCSSRKESTLPTGEDGIWKETREKFMGFGFDRFR